MVESPLLSAHDEGTGRPCERPLEVVFDLFGQTLMRLYTSAFLYIGREKTSFGGTASPTLVTNSTGVSGVTWQRHSPGE